jgi:CBS domain-containing protein
MQSLPAAGPFGVGAADRTPISEIMTKHVVCVRSDLDTRTLASLFLERGISGAPVVDDDARPIGIVSKTDLVRERYERADTGTATEGDTRESSTLEELGFHTEPTQETTVAEIMMPVAFCLPANESIARAAALMAFEGVHRVPVVGNRGQVVGLVSPLDVLRWLAREHGYILSGSR